MFALLVVSTDVLGTAPGSTQFVEAFWRRRDTVPDRGLYGKVPAASNNTMSRLGGGQLRVNLVDQIFNNWNPSLSWLRQLEALRRAAA